MFIQYIWWNIIPISIVAIQLKSNSVLTLVHMIFMIEYILLTGNRYFNENNQLL